MSEYQYYEFQAIDRPLSERERRALRACSTRATITSTRRHGPTSYPKSPLDVTGGAPPSLTVTRSRTISDEGGAGLVQDRDHP